MKRNRLVSLIILFGAMSAAYADLYRCNQPDGKTAYQATPCISGTQKALDDSRAREIQARNADAQKARDGVKANKESKTGVSVMSEKECKAAGYGLAQAYLADMATLIQNGVMASQIMNQGCEKHALTAGQKCFDSCIGEFKDEISYQMKKK